MNDRKSGSFIFFTGLTLGILGGGALVWFIATADHNDIEYQLAMDTSDSHAVKAEYVPQDRDSVNPFSDSNNQGKTEKNLPPVESTPDLNETDSVLQFLDTLTAGNADSTYLEDSLDDYREWALAFEDTFSNASEPLIPRDIRTVKGDPEVLRDVLIYRTEIAVREVSRDSLGQLIEMEADISPLSVSFWKSPVNYKGYRRSGRQLVLYGVYAFDSVQFFRSGPHLYMDIIDDRYLITESYDYKHLVKVSNQPTAIPE